MKLLCNLFALLFVCLIASSASSQSTPLAGFVFVNAIGTAGKADVSANGKKLTNSGLEPGMATSGLGLEVGTYQVPISAARNASRPLWQSKSLKAPLRS